jgi:hypothetical protein
MDLYEFAFALALALALLHKTTSKENENEQMQLLKIYNAMHNVVLFFYRDAISRWERLG